MFKNLFLKNIHWFILILDELQQASWGGFEQSTFDLYTYSVTVRGAMLTLTAAFKTT